MREVLDVRESDRSIVTISSKDFFVQNTVQYVGMAAVVRYSYVQQYCKDLKTTTRYAYVATIILDARQLRQRCLTLLLDHSTDCTMDVHKIN